MSIALSSAEAFELAAGAASVVDGLEPLSPFGSICAPAATCECAPGDNLALHRLLQSAPGGAALVCAAGGRVDVGHLGELMALDARNRGLAGAVIDGSIRDALAVAALGFPVFAAGRHPGKSLKERTVSVGEPVQIGGVEVSPGDQIVADADAVVVVPRERWTDVEAAALELRRREEQTRAELASGRRLSEILGLPE